jgi:hypothetical protein
MSNPLTPLYARARVLEIQRRARNAADFAAALGPVPREAVRGLAQDRHPLSQDLGCFPLLLNDEHARLLAHEQAERKLQESLCVDCGEPLETLVERVQHRCVACFARRFEEDPPNHHPHEVTL